MRVRAHVLYEVLEDAGFKRPVGGDFLVCVQYIRNSSGYGKKAVRG